LAYHALPSLLSGLRPGRRGVTDVSRTITFPDRRLSDKTFPGQDVSRTRRFRTRPFPDNHFPWQDASRKDVSRTSACPDSSIVSRTRRFPDNHFPGHTFPGQAIEKVQRRFTKRLTGLSAYSYSERLRKLNLQNLEPRRIHYDLTLTYQIVFGLSVLKCHEFLQRAQCSHCKRCISYGNSVRPSVRPSVRLSVCHTPVLCQNDGT